MELVVGVCQALGETADQPLDFRDLKLVAD